MAMSTTTRRSSQPPTPPIEPEIDISIKSAALALSTIKNETLFPSILNQLHTLLTTLLTILVSPTIFTYHMICDIFFLCSCQALDAAGYEEHANGAENSRERGMDGGLLISSDDWGFSFLRTENHVWRIGGSFA